jgi:hypothetical protein
MHAAIAAGKISHSGPWVQFSGVPVHFSSGTLPGCQTLCRGSHI